MKWIVLCFAVAFSGLLAGCRNQQEQSPANESAVYTPPPTKPAMPNGPGPIDRSPVSIAGDPVAGSSRIASPNKPSSSSNSIASIRNGLAGGGMPPTMNGPASMSHIRADKEVSGYLRIPNGMAISIEAVCKISEDSIVCKRPDGTRDKNLEAKLDKILQDNQNMYSPSISLRYKKKNRLILFKKEMPAPSGTMVSYASIMQVGEDMNAGYSSYINMSGLSQPYNGQGPRVEYEMRSVAVPTSQHSINAYISSTTPEPLVGTLKIGKGSKLSSGKFAFSFVSVAQSSERIFGPDAKVWELTYKVTKPDQRVQFAFNPIVKGANTGYSAVDQNGELMNRSANGNNEMAPGPQSRVVIRSVMVIPVSVTPTEIKLRSNVNPKNLDGFTVTALRSQVIKLKGIKLD